MSSQDKGCVASWLCSAMWTQSRLHQHGYPVGPGCKLCGTADDTAFHRLFECSAVAQQRLEVVSLPYIRAAKEEKGDQFFSTGWKPHPKVDLPAPTYSELALELWEEGGWVEVEQLSLGGLLFVDGWWLWTGWAGHGPEPMGQCGTH